jgi:hypothetical protein
VDAAGHSDKLKNLPGLHFMEIFEKWGKGVRGIAAGRIRIAGGNDRFWQSSYGWNLPPIASLSDSDLNWRVPETQSMEFDFEQSPIRGSGNEPKATGAIRLTPVLPILPG